VCWGRLDPALKRFTLHGETTLPTTTITVDTIKQYGLDTNYAQLDDLGKLVRWSVVEGFLTVEGFWPYSTTGHILGLSPLRHDRELAVVDDYFIPIAVHHAYQRLYTYYKSIFLSTIKRGATAANDYGIVDRLQSLSSTMSRIYYHYEGYLQLLVADTIDDVVDIEALRLAELGVYYKSPDESGTTMKD
ncbi:electron carrier, partial [Perkinsus olseni]